MELNNITLKHTVFSCLFNEHILSTAHKQKEVMLLTFNSTIETPSKPSGKCVYRC